MKTLNSYLPPLSNGEISLTEIQWVKVVTRNIPEAWKTQFKLSHGHKLKAIIDAQKELLLKYRKQIKIKEKEVFQRKQDKES